jgi:hypothetical protein
MTREKDGPTANDGTRDRTGPTASSDGGTVGADSEWTQVAQRSYDPELEEELTTTIVFAIADAKDVEPTELKSPPLYEVVDASALRDTLFEHGGGYERLDGNGTVTFQYDGHLVEVSDDGWVQVYESAATREE